MEKIFKNWDDIWIRHSVEGEEMMQEANLHGGKFEGKIENGQKGMFPSRYWAPHPGFWCIEVGTAPFKYNITRDHRSFHPLPIINLARYYELNGIPLRPVRDHLAASAQIPIQEWIVLLLKGDLENPDNEELLRESGGFMQHSVANGMIVLSEYLITLMKSLRFRG